MLRLASRAAPWPLALTLDAIGALSACADQVDPAQPAEPPGVEDGVPVRRDFAALLGDRAHWADAYLTALNPTTASYSPGPDISFNRSGGGTATASTNDASIWVTPATTSRSVKLVRPRK